MRLFFFLIHCLLLLTIPSHLLSIPTNLQKEHENESASFSMMHGPNFERVVQLIDSIEKNEMEKSYSLEELERINNFVIQCASEGSFLCSSCEKEVLVQDIHALSFDLEEISLPILTLDEEFCFLIASLTSQEEILLCNWVSKKWKHTKNFVKKHKQAILIGAAIVAATITVVCTVAAISSAAAAGAVANQQESQKDQSKQEPAHTPAAALLEEAPILKEIMVEQISSFKEMILEEEILPIAFCQTTLHPKSNQFNEKVKQLGAYLAHETLDSVSHLSSFIPELHDEIKAIGKQLVSKEKFANDQASKERFDHYCAIAHKKIDSIFLTDQAKNYTNDALALDAMTKGILPPPSLLTIATPNMPTGQLQKTLVSKVIGWKVGDPINNLTKGGNIPKWSTVRQRYWKNEAYLNPQLYETKDLPRMREGLAPRRLNEYGKVESMELHHIPSQKEGGLFDFIQLWPDEHARADTFRRIIKK